MVSEYATIIKKGAIISFDWQRDSGRDDFDVFGCDF